MRPARHGSRALTVDREKTRYTIVGPDDQVLIPRGSAETDRTVRLAVATGRRVRTIGRA